MYTIRREYKGALVFDDLTREYYFIEERYAGILDAVRDGNTVTDVEGLADLTENGIASISDSMISICGRYVRAQKYYDKRLCAPIVVFLQVTNACNMRCKHCFTGDRQASYSNELSTKEVKRLLTHLAKIGVFEVVIGGGEPLCRNDLLEILHHANKVGILPSFTTNGTLITDDIANELADVKLGYIKISLEGNREINDLIRGKGNFDKAIDGLKKLILRRIPVGVRMTVNSINCKDMVSFCEYINDIGCQSVSFSTIRPSGNTKVNRELFDSLTPELYREAMEEILSIKKKGMINISISEDAPFIPQLNDEATILTELLPMFGCPLKGTVCEIDAEGFISPCGFLRGLIGDQVVVGNVREGDFQKLWLESDVLNYFRYLPVPEKCKICSKHSHCHGGCRTRAFYKNSNFDVPDPLCYQFEME